MLQFLHPAGWWALAALGLPLLLHLWRPPARTVRLGTLRFLENLPRRNLRNLRWREPLLLLTRLLLLALLAGLLAGPTWSHRAGSQALRWVLVSPDASLEGATPGRLRALQNTGYELRRFTPGFPPADFASMTSDLSPGAPGKTGDEWSLVRELDAVLPAKSECIVFTPDLVADLHGSRPTLRRIHVDWTRTANRRQDPHAWISSLRQNGVGVTAQLDVCAGVSDAIGIRYLTKKLPAVPGRTQLARNLEVEVVASEASTFSARLDIAREKPTGDFVLAERIVPLAALILHDFDRGEDARYVSAALRAAADTEGREITLITKLTTELVTREAPKPQWVFWLSRQSVPDAISQAVRDGANLVTDANAVGVPPAKSWMMVPADIDHPRLPPGLLVNTHAPGLLSSGVPVWMAGDGETLLSWSRMGQGQRWSFRSRFHPAWNDLPATGALAAVLCSLINYDALSQAGDRHHDQRVAGAGQGAPNPGETPGPGLNAAAVPGGQRSDLQGFVWMLALGFFCVERYLSSRQPSRSERGAFST